MNGSMASTFAYEIIRMVSGPLFALALAGYAYYRYSKRNERGLTDNEENYLRRVKIAEQKKEEVKSQPSYDPRRGEDDNSVGRITQEKICEVYGDSDGEKLNLQIDGVRKRYLENKSRYDTDASVVRKMAEIPGISITTDRTSTVAPELISPSRKSYRSKTKLEEMQEVLQTGTGLGDGTKRRMENSENLYLEKYSELVIYPALTYYFGQGATYKKTRGISYTEFQEIYYRLNGEAFNPLMNNYETEDLVKGSIDGFIFRQSDIRIRGGEISDQMGGRMITLEKDFPIGDDMFLCKRDTAKDCYTGGFEFVDYETGDAEFDRIFLVRSKDEYGTRRVLTPERIRRLKEMQVSGDVTFYYTPKMLWVFRDKVRGMFECDPDAPVDVLLERKYTCLAFEEATEIVRVAMEGL